MNMVELENDKLKSLGVVFDTLMEMQKLRIKNKKNELDTLKNRIKEEKIELNMLEDGLRSYSSQLITYKAVLDNYDQLAKKEAKAINKEAQRMSYVG